MADNLKKLSSLSNEEESFSSGEKDASLIKNVPGSSKHKVNCKVIQVNKLFSGLKLSNEPLKFEEMDFSELDKLNKNLSESGSKNKQFCLAGKIISILENLPVILVQPAPKENAFLNIGVNLFVPKPNPENVENEDWIFLGQIEEVFGNIKDPFYAVRLSFFENNFIKVTNEVYYLSNHPSTSLFHIESGNYHRYNIIHHR